MTLKQKLKINKTDSMCWCWMQRHESRHFDLRDALEPRALVLLLDGLLGMFMSAQPHTMHTGDTWHQLLLRVADEFTGELGPRFTACEHGEVESAGRDAARQEVEESIGIDQSQLGDEFGEVLHSLRVGRRGET